MNPRKTWGQTKISIDGVRLETEPKPSFQPGGVGRDEVEADGRAGFFSEKPIGSKLSCKVLLTANVSLRFLQRLDDATVTVELDTGQTYVVRHAYTAEAVEAQDGKASLVMMGPEAEEMQ